MWLSTELKKLQTKSLSIRQQLDIIQDNEYIRRNLSHLFSISIQIRDAKKNIISGDAQCQNLLKEIKLTWTNILSYLQTLFPIVWKAIENSNVFQDSLSEKIFPLTTSEINFRLQSCKKVIEVFKTLVYGGTLRLPFSQDIYAQNLYKLLLVSCQKSDVSGGKIVAGQNRVIFLQSWLEKLTFTYPLSVYLGSHTKFLSPARPIKREFAQVTDTKYTVSKIPCLNNKVAKTSLVDISSTSSDSENTSFSAYLNKNKVQTPHFVGVKIKFDSDSSNSSYSSTESQDSIWHSVFKKRNQN